MKSNYDKSFRSCMKWFLVPFENKTERLLLYRHFRVATIPSVICLDSNGGIITNCAVRNLESDPTGHCINLYLLRILL